MEEINNEEQKKQLEEEIKVEIRKMLAEADFLRKSGQTDTSDTK
jgi:hypothetical protein